MVPTAVGSLGGLGVGGNRTTSSPCTYLWCGHADVLAWWNAFRHYFDELYDYMTEMAERGVSWPSSAQETMVEAAEFINCNEDADLVLPDAMPPYISGDRASCYDGIDRDQHDYPNPSDSEFVDQLKLRIQDLACAWDQVEESAVEAGVQAKPKPKPKIPTENNNVSFGLKGGMAAIGLAALLGVGAWAWGRMGR